MFTKENQKIEPLHWVSLLFLALVFFEFLFPLFDGKTFFSRDFSFITYPVKHFLAQSFQNGALPFWTPYYQSGTSFIGAFHTGIFYPPSIFFLIQNFTLAINLFYLFHFFILTFPCYFLVRSWNLSPGAAFCSSITILLGGIFLSSVLLSNIFYSLAWFPLIFLSFQNWIIKGSNKYFLFGVIFLACQTLGACPEVCVFTVLIIFFFALVVIRPHEMSTSLKTKTLALSIFVLLALGLSALQLLPTYNLIELSFRKGGLAFGDHVGWSMSLDKLSTFWLAPDYNTYVISGETAKIKGFFSTAYMGIFTANFVLLAFLFRSSSIIRFWLLVFFIGIFLSLGGNNFFYEYIWKINPLLKVFRYPEKYFVLSAIASVFIVGLIFDKIYEGCKNKTLNLKYVLLINSFSMLIVSLLWFENRSSYVFLPLALIFALSLLTVFVYYEKFKIKYFQILLPFMVVLDLLFNNFSLIPFIDKKIYDNKPALLQTIKKETDNFRLYSGNLKNKINFKYLPPSFNLISGTISQFEFLVPYIGMKYGVENVSGIPGLGMGLKNTGLWYELLFNSTPERRLRLLKRSNVKFGVAWDAKTNFSGNYPIMTPEHLKIFDDALPRAFLVPKMQKGKELELLNTYYSEEFDPLQTVLLSEPVEFQETPNFKGEVESIKYSPNHVTIQTNQKGNGFLVLLDSYFPGWTVTVDGEERKILQANHFYRAVQLGPGRHTLEFDFYPVGFTEGLIISGISFVILILLTIYWRPFEKKKMPTLPNPISSTLPPKKPDPVVSQHS